MNRYSPIPTKTSTEGKKIYKTVRYPEIPRLFSDTYIYTTIGDRYDTLSEQFYGDSSLWWIISLANNTLKQDSLTPPPGTQLRIPSDPSPTIAEYELLNE